MGQLVLAFHGCDISTRDALIRGDLKTLDQSTNAYDWLGNGIYMFLDDWERALKLATFAAENPEKLLTKRPIITPAVVGCILDVDRWLDLTTESGRQNFKVGAKTLKAAAIAAADQAHQEPRIPQNKPAFDGDVDILHRAYDCAVCNMIHSIRKIEHQKAIESQDLKKISETLPYQVTRSIFEQGESVEGSCIYDGSHIQIAVHKDECIRGWFLIKGENLLKDAAYQTAKQSIEQAVQARRNNKPRVRPRN